MAASMCLPLVLVMSTFAIDIAHGQLHNVLLDHPLSGSESVRLRGGPQTRPGDRISQGRVEVKVEGRWGTICSNGWGIRDADVVCRELGFQNGYPVHNAHHGRGDEVTPIVLDHVACRGDESALLECAHNEYISRRCTHDMDAGVICKGYINPLIIKDVKLIDIGGEEHSYKGVVDVRVQETWVMVCADRWTNDEARVTCRQLGYRSGVVGQSSDTFPLPRKNGMVKEVRCNGDESELSQCDTRGAAVYGCADNAYATVRCEIYGSKVSNLRLVGGMDQSEGVIQVYHDGQWWGVCDDGWTEENARVVCNQLGYRHHRFVPNNEAYHVFHISTGSFLMDEVRCHGDERSLFDCKMNKFNQHDCRYDEGAGVICLDRETAPDQRHAYVHIAKGNSTAGLVYIDLAQGRGLVCDDGITDVEATALCRTIEEDKYMYNRGEVLRSSHMTLGEGDVIVTRLHCTRSHVMSILECSMDIIPVVAIDTSYCSSGQATISCSVV